jgi:hypothetical protein
MRKLATSSILSAAILTVGAIAANAQAPGFDGAYLGMMTQMETPTGAGNTQQACEYKRPVNMTVVSGDVTISYLDWQQNTIHYRGAVDPTGAVTAWHTNGDGTRSILTGQLGATGFTGHMDRDRQLCPYEVTMQLVARRAAAR